MQQMSRVRLGGRFKIEGFFCLLGALFLCACGVGLCLLCLPVRRLFLCAYGVGLSLISNWFISVAPVRGRHLLFFARRKEK